MKTFEKIFTLVNQIPSGNVATYGQIARLVGLKNARVVGFAMHANKNLHIIPCHRVVSSTGKLTGYAMGGITVKKSLLKKEGVEFLDSDTVNLEKSLYKFLGP
jgi:methylated-DNA-protein-cysteine methyltransferase-like protein